MKYSSKANPCPVCGRDTDDKCRWNDRFLFCYFGDCFSAPDLRIGATIEVPGWPRLAVVGREAGFAGSSLVLAPDLGPGPSGGQDGATRRAAADIAARVEAKKAIAQVRREMRKALATTESFYHSMNLLELREYRENLVDRIEYAKQLREFILPRRLRVPRSRQILLAVGDCVRTLKYCVKDVDIFVQDNLSK